MIASLCATVLGGGCTEPFESCVPTRTCPPPKPEGGTGGDASSADPDDHDDGGSPAEGGVRNIGPGSGGTNAAGHSSPDAGAPFSGAGDGGGAQGGTSSNPGTTYPPESGGAPSDLEQGGSAGLGGEAGGGASAIARCDPTQAFGAPTYVPAFSLSTDRDATVTGDGLTLVVWRGASLLSATRANTADGSFSAPEADPLLAPLAEWFHQSEGDDVPSLTGDGLAAYGDFGGQGRNNIYAAFRKTPSDAFGTGAPVEELYDRAGFHPFISFDGQTLYFMNYPGGRPSLLISERNGSTFGTPRYITSTDSPEGSDHPVISADELSLYFFSTRTDGTAKGKGDIWLATRARKADDFGLPHAVDELNSAGDEVPLWIAPDGCEILLLRDQHISFARRPR